MQLEPIHSTGRNPLLHREPNGRPQELALVRGGPGFGDRVRAGAAAVGDAVPLEDKRTASGFSAEDKESMQREYTRLLRLAGAMVPDFARYDLALRELKRTDCEREDECLVQLAKRAEALYAVCVSLDYTLEGAVVRGEWARGS